MKKRRVFLLCIAILLLALLAGGCAADGSGDTVLEIVMDEGFAPALPAPEEDTVYGMYDSAEARLGGMEKVAEDGTLELWFDNTYLEIGVRDKESGEIWLSAPYDYKKDTKASSETKSTIASLLTLTYFDISTQTQTEKKMASFTECAAKAQFGTRALPDGSGIEVQMLIGRIGENLMVPYASEKEVFENKILANIESDRDVRRMKSYYTLYSWSDESMSKAVRDSLLENYPGIVDHDLYILRGSNDREKKVLEEIIRQTEYSREDLERDDEISGFVAQAESQALFKVNVEFSLKDGTLTVSLPAGDIEYDRSAFLLGKVQILEFFGAGKSANEGYMMIPDGSGALIDFNTSGTKPMPTIIKPVYGDDASLIWYDWHDNINEAARMPVYGLKEGNKAYFAIVEEGDALADIIAQSGNITCSYETVSPSFYYTKSFLVTYNDGVKQSGNYRYFDKNEYAGAYRLRFSFLSGEEADYNGMAKHYREYLAAKGALTPLEGGNETAPLYLEVLGKLEKQDTFMGIPYDRHISLTSFDDAQTIMEELGSAGAGNIALRYRGWQGGGLDYTLPTNIKVENALGGSKGLTELIAWTDSAGHSVYLDVDFTIVRRTGLFSGYSNLFDGPKSIDNNPVYSQPKEMVTNMGYIKWDYYTISPNRVSEYFAEFIKSIGKKNLERHVSVASAGTTLLADYNRKRPVNLQQSRDITVDSLAALREAAGKILIDGGNAYALPYADKIMNIPTAGSSYILADRSIPFMQLVLHGYISYGGRAANMSGNRETSLLKSVEYGAAPSYTVAYANTEELKDSVYSFYYAVDYETWRENIIGDYEAYNAVLGDLEKVPMERHDLLAEGVGRTLYQNGTAILVNYNAEAVTVTENGKEITVEGRSFRRIEGEKR